MLLQHLEGLVKVLIMLGMIEVDTERHPVPGKIDQPGRSQGENQKLRK